MSIIHANLTNIPFCVYYLQKIGGTLCHISTVTTPHGRYSNKPLKAPPTWRFLGGVEIHRRSFNLVARREQTKQRELRSRFEMVCFRSISQSLVCCSFPCSCCRSSVMLVECSGCLWRFLHVASFVFPWSFFLFFSLVSIGFSNFMEQIKRRIWKNLKVHFSSTNNVCFRCAGYIDYTVVKSWINVGEKKVITL